MTSSVAPGWTTAPWWTLSDLPYAGLANAVRPSVVATAGCVRSTSGHVALIVSVPELRMVPGVEVAVEAPVEPSATMVLVLTDHHQTNLAAELRDLTAVGDLTAVPYALSADLPADFARRGHIEQLIEPDQPATFDVFERTEDVTDRLIADAPIHIGEGPDNLRGREDWFRRRQSGGDS